jgi:hypothetical protein
MKTIEELADEAGIATTFDGWFEETPDAESQLARFAALVAEQCARECDAEQQRAAICVGQLAGAATAMETARVLAGAIRAAYPMPKE